MVPTLDTARIRLTPLGADEDLGEYLGWVNDAETTRYMGVGATHTTRQQLEDYVRAFQSSDNGYLFAIRLHPDMRHVGNITLQHIDRHHRSAEIGILLGDPSNRGRGLGTEAIGLVVRFAFEDLGLHRLSAGYVEGNEASARAFEKNGFRVEGRSREAFRSGDRWLDAVRLGLLVNDYVSVRDIG